MASILERICFHEAAHCTAALCYAVPFISVTIDPDHPHMHRGNYRPPDGIIGLEAMVVVCVSGPIGEQIFCGTITDGSDQGDLERARGYLRAAGCDELRVGAGLEQARTAARGLLTSPWGSQRVRLIADALLQHGTLTGDEIGVMIAADA